MREFLTSIICFVVGFAIVDILRTKILGSLELSIIFLASIVLGSALFIGRQINNLKDNSPK